MNDLSAQNDSLFLNKKYLDSLLRDNMQEEMQKNIRLYQEKQNYSTSMEIFGHIRQTANRAQEFLNKGLDTVSIKNEFEQLGIRYKQTISGVFPVQDVLPSYRNLSTTELLLGELVIRLNARSRTLQRYLSETETFRSEIDSLISDTTIYQLPSVNDSMLFDDYVNELTAISMEVTPVDKLINETLRNLRKLDQEAGLLLRNLQVNIKLCAQYREELTQRLLQSELPLTVSKKAAIKPLREGIKDSIKKSELLLQFYARNNIGLIFLAFLLFLASAALLTMLRNKFKIVSISNENSAGREVIDFPITSALFLALTICQFFFRWPPFVFYGTGWLIAAITVTRIYLRAVNPSLKFNWLIFLGFFILVYADNLLLFYSATERYFLLTVALLSVIISSMIFIRSRYHQQFRMLVMVLSGMLAFLSLLSFISNITGHYNLSKLLLTSGYFGVMNGVLLFFTGKLINDWLNLASDAIANTKTRIYLNFRKEEKAIPGLLKWVLAGGWLILFIRSFPFYQVIATDVRSTLLAERSIGNFSYTLSSILIFITVLISAVMLSKFIALFTSNEHVQPGNSKTEKKGGINNWLLLIRISVITAGILLAFASAGIPMDKITIIIGSLGVGIGLGLQNIVGNLFSGIILAFERPFEIGDQIEVDNRRGKVKEMGFRSSRIITFEGSEVIIPNGDLLSHHVINYTLSNNFTRVELMVGVKYGSNLQEIKQVLENMLRNNPHVRQHPLPQVLLHSFSESSVDFRLLFWSDINIWVELKSEIILAVDHAFREAGIEIPYPQLDVHIISSPGTAAKPGDDNPQKA